jgi:hypothetical protein
MTIEEVIKRNKAGARSVSLPSALPALQMPKLVTPAKTSGTQMPVLGKTTSKGVGIVQSVANGSGTQSSGRTTAPKVKTVKPTQQSAVDRAANIRAFGAGDYSGGGELLEKAYKTARAAVKGIGSSYANIGGSAVEGMGNLQETMQRGEYDKKIQQMKDNKAFYEQALKTGVNPRTGKRLTVDERSRYYKVLNTMYTDGKIAEMENIYKDATASQKAQTMETANAAFAASDRLKASADKDVAAAKEGSGKAGQFLVDLGYTGTQLLADTAANAIAPGAGMVSMASRVYGDASAEARREGKTAGQQALSGLKGATIEVLTEKLFGGLAKAYGAGTADELVEKVADKLTKTEAGKRAAVWLINSGGEGLEEVVSDVLNPLADRALGLDDGTGAIFTTDDAAQMAYDFLLGGTMGLIGSSGQLRRGRTVQMPTLERTQDAGTVEMPQFATEPTAQDAQTAPGVNFNAETQNAAERLTRADTEAGEITMPRVTDAAGNTYAQRQAAATFNDGSKSDAEGVLGLLRSNIPALEGIEPVANVTGQEVGKTGRVTDRVYNFFQSIGGKVRREGFGDVLFSKSKVKNSMVGHGIGDAKIELAAAVPGVIENGVQINYTPNWKGRGYDSYVFAAPVTYKGAETYVTAVVVRDTANRYYLHEALDAEGNVLYKKAEGPDVASDTPAAEPRNHVANIEPSVDSIAQTEGTVNEVEMPVMQEAETAAEEAGAAQTARQTVEQMDAEFDAMAEEARAKQRQREAEGYEMPETLRRLGVDPFGSEADYAGAETLAREARNNNSARKQMQKQISKMAFTEKERTFARQLANDKITWQDVPPTMDMDRLATLTDFYRAMDNDPAAGLLSRRRDTILERETAKMEPLLGMDVTYDEGGMTDSGKRSGKIAKKFSTLRRNLQTPARVCETEWGTEHGRKVYDELFYPVTENNGRQITWVNSMLDRVRTFTDGTGKKRALNRKERELVQKLVEYSASQDRVAKFSKQYAPAVENVRNGAGVEDSAKEFGIDKSSQEYADLLNYKTYLTAVEELTASTEADGTAVQAAVKAYGDIYKELYEGINTFLVAHGYQPIGFIEGYAPHLQPESERTAFSKALKMLGLDDAAMELPTSISGQTADLKPYKQYNPFFQERRGDKTEYDIAKGFENYVYYLGNIFYHTDDIMRIRAAERYIRKTYSSEEANEMITQAEDARNFSDADIEEFLRMNGLVGKNTTLDEGDARILLNDYIDKLYDQIGNVTRYSEMAKYLDNYANRLAGKQNYVDRGAEAATGRGSLNWINTLSGKYGGAKLAFNVSSAINQTSQLPMVAVENGEKYTAAAMRDFFKKDRSSFVNESNFLKGKKGVNWLLGAETGWEKFKQAGFSMTEAVDSFTAYTAVRSKYLKEVAAGKSHAEAIKLADDYGRRVMGSRARGEKPVLFDTKNPFWQIATRFQLETLNSWEHVSRDLPNEFRKMAGEKGKTYAARVMGGRAAKYVLYAFLANLAVGELSGGSPVPFDLLGNTMEALGKAWGLTKSQTVATLLDSVLQAVFDERLFGTPEPEDDDDADWWAALESLFGNVANDVPVVSRAAALAGVGDQTLAVADLSKIADLAKSVKDKGLTSADTLDKAATAGGEFLYGGNQLRKTIQGTMDVLRGGRYNNGKLRYQVDQTPWNYFKGAVFGRSSLDEAQDYYAERSSDFSAKQTETFGNLQSAGVAAKESYDLIQEMRGIEKTDDESKAELQRKALMASNISGEGKAAAYYGLLATDKEKAAMDAIGDAEPTADMGEVTGLLVRFKSCKNDTEKLAALQDSGLTLSQKTSIYTNLIASEEALKEQSDLEAYDGITAEKYYLYKTAVTGLTGKAAKLAAINALDLLSEEKDALYFANGWAESKLSEAPWRSGSSYVEMPVLNSNVEKPVMGRPRSSELSKPVMGSYTGNVGKPVMRGGNYSSVEKPVMRGGNYSGVEKPVMK